MNFKSFGKDDIKVHPIWTSCKQELIGLCDALGVYLRVLYNDDKKSIFSQIKEPKTKVSLIKPVTIYTNWNYE